MIGMDDWSTDSTGRKVRLVEYWDEDEDQLVYLVEVEDAPLTITPEGVWLYKWASCPCDPPSHERLGPLPHHIAQRARSS